MKRVHDFDDSDDGEVSTTTHVEPGSGKGKPSRKRKGQSPVNGAVQMKRTASNQPRTQNVTMTKSQASHFGRLANAQLRHDQLQAQLARQFPRMNPQDVDSYHAMNVRVQELQNLAQEIRQLKNAQNQIAVYSG